MTQHQTDISDICNKSSYKSVYDSLTQMYTYIAIMNNIQKLMNKSTTVKKETLDGVKVGLRPPREAVISASQTKEVQQAGLVRIRIYPLQRAS